MIDDLQNFRILYRTYLTDRYREMCINNHKINLLYADSQLEKSYENSDYEGQHSFENPNFDELRFILNQKVKDGVILERFHQHFDHKEHHHDHGHHD